MIDAQGAPDATRGEGPVRAARRARFDRVLGAYDLRGRIGHDLDDDLLYALGFGAARAFGAQGATEVVIGCDMRPDSPRFAESAAAGVIAGGLRARFVGLCSTDQLYFASGLWDLPGLMVTASHNPADYNGVKVCGAGATGVSRDQGLGEVRDAAVDAPRRAADHSAVAVDDAAARELAAAFAQRLRDLTGLDRLRPVRPLTIVADAGNGMAGKLLGEVFGTDAGMPAVPFDVIGLYTELDGTFPNHPANPLEPENLLDVRDVVRAQGADLGLAFDGDADRCFFIDGAGDVLSPSAIGALVAEREIMRARDEGEVQPVVLHNLITSRIVAETVEASGGTAVRTPVGHSRIKQLMREHDAVFAAEHSAHFYFRDFYSADSGMLAACHVIALLARTEDSAQDLVARRERYVASGEINSTVTDPDAVLADFAARARTGEFGDGDVVEFDGVSLEGRDFWANVRKSNTEPLVRFNCETPTAERTRALTEAVLARVRSLTPPGTEPESPRR
ncbi:phosphomannomutase/phosphoglucomutase [Brevibacterium jeotgali]|uniref:Phosphomannomutase n=1 Tax=Brevibacterium jeotgali TaxID=1262550 RepID=A0A2H1L6L2_9MICO|nr:phosphomannomutase/phosphoglucomutase [Brevibacterium jeotgali]TWC03567.1 phosphomannomutase [Brevibacterium jeotgali]SMY12390.1 phosphomannomutase [Brevibacterium jeotgali]